MDIPKYIDIGIKKYVYESLADNRWAKATYIELGDQIKLLNDIEDKTSKEYLMQLGVVRYFIKNLDSYITLVRVS